MSRCWSALAWNASGGARLSWSRGAQPPYRFPLHSHPDNSAELRLFFQRARACQDGKDSLCRPWSGVPAGTRAAWGLTDMAAGFMSGDAWFLCLRQAFWRGRHSVAELRSAVRDAWRTQYGKSGEHADR